jgi:hypothetical protein
MYRRQYDDTSIRVIVSALRATETVAKTPVSSKIGKVHQRGQKTQPISV